MARRHCQWQPKRWRRAGSAATWLAGAPFWVHIWWRRPLPSKKLKLELDQLKNIDRQKVIRDIAEARDHGDLSENAEYHAARERQSFIEGKIVELENKISRADVIDTSTLDTSKIVFGATVELVDLSNDTSNIYKILQL